MSDDVRRAIYKKPVLIVDSDEFFRIALSSVLKSKLGFTEVIEASSFHEAVEQLVERTDVGLAIFEINMPGMDNWVNLRTFRTSYPDVRVSVVSGSQKRKDILMALEAGLHGYVYKGLGAAELERALRLICDGNIYVPAILADFTTTDPLGRDESSVDLRKDSRLISSMTLRQKEILALLVAGKSNKGMARSLGLSEGTVKFHMAAVFRVLGSSNRVEAATAGSELLRDIEVSGSRSRDRSLALVLH